MAYEKEIHPMLIQFCIYAKDQVEADNGRKAIIEFINIMRDNNAPVTGNKLKEAVGKLGNNPFITSQIIKFFKKQ